MFKKENLNKLKICLVKFASDLDSDNLIGLIKLSESYKLLTLQPLEKYAHEIGEDKTLDSMSRSMIMDQLGDQADNIRDISSIGEELAIIGLYKTLEITIKKCARLSGLFSDKEISGMFNFKKLESNFEKKGIIIKNIENFKEFNELRLINNSLKHSGKVDMELHELDPLSWEIHSEITHFPEHFKRLINPSLNFLRLLGIEIASKII
ncbi:hypothetical protein EXE10_17640 [Acinetobacter sp. WCHAc060033]|uniref:hypothetical protein n=1 Tax=Acinetobacter sp. WCHAc060033 TaxID=2518624 RepID=UPI0010236D51|nr:hypothetical protein [Acinetobacter sp. WCHAc060033]RZG78569.1 hypothetical protein EXE10_17640 [Acinetobacter sp. WCHAc060033]